MIVGSTVPGQPNGFLVTDEAFGNFILELEVSDDRPRRLPVLPHGLA
jgi:hypothetical protein